MEYTTSENNNFRLSLGFSILLHFFALYFIFFSKPNIHKSLPEEKIITFEILDIEDVNNITKQNQKTEKPNNIPIEEARKVLESKAPSILNDNLETKKILPPENKEDISPTPLPNKTTPTKETLDEPKKEEILNMEKELKDIIVNKPEEITTEIDKKIEENNQPIKELEAVKEIQKNDEKKIQDKKIPKKTQSSSELESLLKNLDTPSKGIDEKSKKIAQPEGDKNVTTKGPSTDGKTLSLTEISLIKKQIEKSWNLPAGAVGANNVLITLFINFDQNGEVLEVKLTKADCPGTSPIVCKAISNSAIRAVKKASPIDKLRKDRYDIWGKINIEFDPSHILR